MIGLLQTLPKKMMRAGLISATVILAQLHGSDATSAPVWQSKYHVFRIGIVVGNRPVLEVRRIAPFKRALQNAINLPVEVFAARDFGALIMAMADRRIDYAVFSATAHAMAWKNCKCVEPLAMPMAQDGSSGFHSVLIGRSDGLRQLSELKNKSVIIPGKHSFSGYHYPSRALSAKGIHLGDASWPVRDLGTMPAAIGEFISGKGDALTGWIPTLGDQTSSRGTLQKLLHSAGGADRTSNYRIIWKSDKVPHGPHSVHSSLPLPAKRFLRTFLLQLLEKHPVAYFAIDPFLGGGFKPAHKIDYQPLVALQVKSR